MPSRAKDPARAGINVASRVSAEYRRRRDCCTVRAVRRLHRGHRALGPSQGRETLTSQAEPVPSQRVHLVVTQSSPPGLGEPHICSALVHFRPAAFDRED